MKFEQIQTNKIITKFEKFSMLSVIYVKSSSYKRPLNFCEMKNYFLVSFWNHLQIYLKIKYILDSNDIKGTVKENWKRVLAET